MLAMIVFGLGAIAFIVVSVGWIGVFVMNIDILKNIDGDFRQWIKTLVVGLLTLWLAVPRESFSDEGYVAYRKIRKWLYWGYPLAIVVLVLQELQRYGLI